MSAGACEGCLVWLLLMCQGFIFLCSRLLTLVRQFVLDPEQVGGVGRGGKTRATQPAVLLPPLHHRLL